MRPFFRKLLYAITFVELNYFIAFLCGVLLIINAVQVLTNSFSVFFMDTKNENKFEEKHC